MPTLAWACEPRTQQHAHASVGMAPVTFNSADHWKEKLMRRPFIAGNWKMNLNRAAAVALAEAVAKKVEACDGVDLAVCPPFCYLKL